MIAHPSPRVNPSNYPEVPERLDDKVFPVGAPLLRLVPGRRRAIRVRIGQTATLLGAGDVNVLDVDAVYLLYPAGDVRIGGLAGDHALVVAVVIQKRQDAERPVVQRDEGMRKAKVRTSA